MAKEIALPVTPREVEGKEVKKLRKQGILPGVLFGFRVNEPTPVQVEERLFERVYRQAGMSTMITVEIDSKVTAQAMIHKVTRDPVTHNLSHFDLMAVNPREEITTDVPLVIMGEAPGDRAAEIVLLHELNTVSLRGLPADLPPVVEVDVTGLEEVDQAVYVKDLKFPDSVTLLTDPETMVAKLSLLRIEPEPEPEVEETEEAAEGEGEATADAGEGAEAEAEEDTDDRK